MDKVLGAYAAVPGADLAAEKSVRFSSRFVALGTEVDGERGHAGVPVARRRLISQLCAALAARHRCDRKMLERLLGNCVPILQHRKELAACLDTIYAFVREPSYGKMIVLPARVRDELCAMGLLCAVAFTDLRWAVSSTLSAIDAAPLREGACQSPVDLAFADSLLRLCEHKGEYVRLDWSDQLTNLPPESQMARPQA